MTINVKNLLLFASPVLMLVGAAPRVDASDLMKVNVPFSFVVHGQTLPAGQYRLQRDDMDPAVLRIQGVKGTHASMFVLTNGAAGHDPDGDKPALSFTRSENTYRLSTIWESATGGRTIVGKK